MIVECLQNINVGLTSLFSAHVHNMEGESAIELVAFFKVYLPIVQAKRLEDDSEFEIFSTPNYSKFAEECDWNRQSSQILIISKWVKVGNLQ